MSQLQVVCGLVWRQGMFLAARKKAGKSNAGLWELPGGKVAESETAGQALIREFQEELGMELEVGRFLGSVEQGGAANLRLIALEARCEIEQPTHSSDHDTVVWVAPEFWRLLNWCGNDARLLEEIFGAISRG
jgi:8-oxo-dGTP diphosphatase